MELVNLGCGLNVADSWTNIDRSPNLILDRVPLLKKALRKLGVLSEAHMAAWPRNIAHHDVRRGLPFDDRSVDAIYSSHMLEHMYFNEAEALLVECRRVLRPDGVLRLALPDAGRWASDLVSGESDGLRFNERLGAWPLEAPTRGQRLRFMVTGSVHRWQPTGDLVEQMLTKAGFGKVERCEYLAGRLPDLRSVEHRAESLFVEAS